MAALRIFARTAIIAIRATPATGCREKNAFPIVYQAQKRWATTVNVKGPRNTTVEIELPDFEVSKDPQEWAYVEWCLKDKWIPKAPTNVETLPSGWKPQKESAKLLPYFVERTKSHMVPVYLRRSQRGMRRLTVVRRIQGDIMLLEKELKAYLEDKVCKQVGSQVNEPAGLIKFRGDYVSHCKNFLDSKGF